MASFALLNEEKKIQRCPSQRVCFGSFTGQSCLTSDVCKELASAARRGANRAAKGNRDVGLRCLVSFARSVRP